MASSVSRSQRWGAAMTIGMSSTNGGTGKNAESMAATTRSAVNAAGLLA